MKHTDDNHPRYQIFKELMPEGLTLVPQLNEVYELELAYLESRLLSNKELIRNSAYFSSVEGKPTRHFLICSGEPLKLANHSSSRLRAFFQNNQFKTGYGTHGLFPYRGKFHPQMIKALLNIMKIKPGGMVLDPMMGSGTVLIEATLMGINSYGVDASPFCKFMTQSKIDGLSIDIQKANGLKSNELFHFFKSTFGSPNRGRKIGNNSEMTTLTDYIDENTKKPVKISKKMKDIIDDEKLYNFLSLAYLDSAGYAERSRRKTHFEQFSSIFERYIFVAEKIQSVMKGLESQYGNATPLEGDARKLEFKDNFFNGIIFSPPYSFAIDYIDNDAFHLKQLNVNIPKLKESMVGLRGKRKKDQYELYITDMRKIISECFRVLKKGYFCTIVVGTNRNQIASILRKDPNEVKAIDEILIDIGIDIGFEWERSIERQITGMHNTMRTEQIIMLKK